jgi:hypothetical protein
LLGITHLKPGSTFLATLETLLYDKFPSAGIRKIIVKAFAIRLHFEKIAVSGVPILPKSPFAIEPLDAILGFGSRPRYFDRSRYAIPVYCRHHEDWAAIEGILALESLTQCDSRHTKKR